MDLQESCALLVQALEVRAGQVSWPWGTGSLRNEAFLLQDNIQV